MTTPNGTAGSRVPDGAKHPRELEPGEYMRTKDGFWFVRPPAPGYLQHLNAAAHRVDLEVEDPAHPGLARITVTPAIVQPGGAWRLQAGTWASEPARGEAPPPR